MTLDPGIEIHDVFHRCVEDSNDAVMITDARGTLAYVNPAWTRIYGYSSSEAIGNNPRLLHSGQHSPDFYAAMWAQIADPARGHWKGEVVNRAKDGKLVTVLLSIMPFRGPDGVIRGYMGIAMDITEKKDLEARVLHQDRLASIGILASGLAHEVGTPLGVIRGRAEMLMMRTPDRSTAKGLEIIVGQIDRISKLIRSLLRLSRPTSEISLEAVELGALASGIAALLGREGRSEHFAIEVNVPEGLRAQADSSHLEQILLNLTMNSAHAIRQAIQAGRRGPHKLCIEAFRKGDRVELAVLDSGTGIPPENMKKLFKPFFTTKDVGEGTGLGLAIVAKLVQELQGEIRAESVPNQGSAFRITLRSA